MTNTELRGIILIVLCSVVLVGIPFGLRYLIYMIDYKIKCIIRYKTMAKYMRGRRK